MRTIRSSYSLLTHKSLSSKAIPQYTARTFTSTSNLRKGLSPETDDPKPQEAEDHNSSVAPTDITIEEYHKISDKYMDKMVEELEALQEDREDVDVEFSVCYVKLKIENEKY